MKRTLLVAAIGLSLTGCSGFEERDGAPGHWVDVSTIPDPTPRHEPFSKYGNPDSYEVFGKTYHVQESAEGHVEQGIASWYGTKFHGRRTSSGEPYDMYKMTAAHKTLPLPTYAEVVNLDNGRKITVKINDRGPFHDGRIIDLSYAAAIKLGINEKGTGRVEVRAITPVAQGVMQTAQAATPLPAMPDGGGEPQVYLQVASFSDRDNMQSLLDRLLDAAIDRIQITQGRAEDRRPVYRLRIGPMMDKASAGELMERLAGLGITTPYIIVD